MRVCSGKQRFRVSPLGLCLPLGQGVSGLPLAPWAPVLCKSSLDLEINPKRAPLWGEGGWGLKMPCVHWPHHPTLCKLGRDPVSAHLRKGKKLASSICLRESETLLQKPSSAPMRVCSVKQRIPVTPLGLCLHWAKEGLGCLLVRVHWCFAGHR